MKLFVTLLDSRVIALLGISFLLFVLGAMRQQRRDRDPNSTITVSQAAKFILWQALDHWVNYILYPLVVVSLGLVRGWLVMTLVTLVMNVVYVLVNNSTEEDWTFMSWFTYLRDGDSCVWPIRYCRVLRSARLGFLIPCCIRCLAGIRRLFRLRVRGFSLSNTFGFLYLTVWKDSFYAINFLFGKSTDLLNARVATLFLLSHVICNAVWVPVAGLMGGLFKLIHLVS